MTGVPISLQKPYTNPAALITSLTRGAVWQGMAMTTFCRSNGTCASYSMFTYESPPLTLGQQLIVSGTRDSSLVCKRPGKINGEGSLNLKVPVAASHAKPAVDRQRHARLNLGLRPRRYWIMRCLS